MDGLSILTPWQVRQPVRAKRILDVVGSLVGLVALSPIMAATALAIRLDSAGPALFRQVRVGKDERPFVMLKFRTMHEGASLAPLTSKADPRVTRVGRFLRKVRLDELPQLVNVLRGEMSLVGPRPMITKTYRGLVEIDPLVRVRTMVKPGITGLAQVRYKFPQGTEEYLRKCKFDRAYVRRNSLSMDLRILWSTIWVVLGARGL